MWELWMRAKTYHKLPSELMKEADSLAAWMLDGAVTWFGITIENLLQERDKVQVGTTTEYRPRYALSRLLDDNFRLPKPITPGSTNYNPWSGLLSWVGKQGSGVKKFAYQKPVD